MSSEESWLSKMKDNKLISLFIDTATKALSVGAQYGNTKFTKGPMDSKKALEQTNLAIEELGRQGGFALKDVDNFYCLLGPGSNTGIRLGLTIPKTILAFKPEIHIYGIETLKLFLVGRENDIAALTDRSGNLFIGYYKNDEYHFEKICKDDFQALDQSKTILIEDKDIIAEEELKAYRTEKINVLQKMMDHPASFLDFTGKEEEYLPIYSQAI